MLPRNWRSFRSFTLVRGIVHPLPLCVVRSTEMKTVQIVVAVLLLALSTSEGKKYKEGDCEGALSRALIELLCRPQIAICVRFILFSALLDSSISHLVPSVCVNFLTGLLERMKENGADSSNSDVVEAELVNTCKTAVKKDEKFVSFTCRVLYHTYAYTSGHVNVMFSPYPHVFFKSTLLTVTHKPHCLIIRMYPNDPHSSPHPRIHTPQCYYIGASSISATRLVNEVTRPLSNGVPPSKICHDRLRKKDAQICELAYGELNQCSNACRVGWAGSGSHVQNFGICCVKTDMLAEV